MDKNTIMKNKTDMIKNRYKIAILDSIDISTLSIHIPLAVNKNNIYIADRGNIEYNIFSRANVLSFDLNSKKSDLLINSIKLQLSGVNSCSLLSICYVSALDCILYPETDSTGKTIIKKFNVKKKITVNFSKINNENYLYIYSIKNIDDYIFITDYCTHTIIKFSLEGDLLQKIVFKKHFEFPVDVEKWDNDNLVIFFTQEDGRIHRQIYSNMKTLKDTHFVIWNHTSNTYKSVKSDFEMNAGASAMVGNEGNFFISDGENLTKLDHSLKVIFRMNIIREIEKYFNFKKIDDGSAKYNRLYLHENK